MARRLSVVRGRAGPRRATAWAGLGWANNTFTTEGGTLLTSLTAAGLALRPFTVIRSYVSILVVSDQAAAVEKQLGAIAAMVVSDQAFAVGVTAVPTPITDAGSDLFFLHNFFAADESNLTDRTKGGLYMTYSSKAMRKVNEDQDLLTVAELDGEGSGFILLSAFRFLLKLH